ncbi:MAG TPA: hemerythrin domain-containing protein [Actinomycetes bacterium]|jgi:iron-sulfur cluster repair protein YtfE (RIC family)
MSTNREVIAAIRAHHDQLSRDLVSRSLAVQGGVDRLAAGDDARAGLVAFLHEELLPHAAAEEKTLYAAGADLPATRLLVAAMVAEHRVLEGLVDDLAGARTPSDVAGTAAALRTLFLTHLAKENDLLLPALDESGADLGSLLAGMHELLGDSHDEVERQESGCGCGGCACGG